MQVTEHTEDVVYAGFWRRWAALFLDQIVLGIGFYATTFALAMIAAVAGGFDWLGSIDSDDPPLAVVAGYVGFVLLYYVAAGLYYALMESSRHQATLGKMALGIKVVDRHGQRLSFGRAIGRWFAAALSYFTLYIGFLMAAFTERKRALHDMVAGTLVVDRWAFTGHPELQRRELGGCLVAIILAVLLAIMVAILGVLAAIAIPAYQEYVQRAKVAQAAAEIMPLKGLVSSFQAREGRCPVNGEGGIGAAGTPGSAYATTVTVGEYDDGGCGIELELGNTGSEDIDGGRIWWQLEQGSGRWICSSSVVDRWLPQECRG